MPRTYEPIASQTLGADAGSVEFTSIPGTYTDLILVANASSTHTAATELRMRFSGSSATNYSTTRLIGDGSAASSTRDTSGSSYGYMGHLNNSSTAFTTIRAHIMSYANTNVFTTMLVESGAAGSAVHRQVSLWRLTDAVTSILLISGAGNIRSGSTFSLYGVRAA